MGGIDANIAAEEILLHADLKNESTEIVVDISADRIALSAEIELQEKEISADIESAQPEIDGNLPGKLVFYVNGGEIDPSSGGYYVPAVHQIDDSTMEISFDASKESMPDVAPVPITLPSGPPGPKGETPEVRIGTAVTSGGTGSIRHGVTIKGPRIVDEETGSTTNNQGTVWDGVDGVDGKPGASMYTFDSENGLLEDGTLDESYVNVPEGFNVKTGDLLLGTNGNIYLVRQERNMYGKYVWTATFVSSIKGNTGEPGTDGITPHVGENGNWFIGTDDTGVPATGPAGNDGLPGKDGYTPVKGVDYFDGQPGEPGKDGYTPVKGVDYFDGEPGKDGTPGADGYTPQKGVDYWTTEDIQSMITDAVNGVLAQKSNILKTAFPVGSEYVMSENKNPADVLGFGTWELVGKGFKDAQGSSASSFFTEDTTNTDTCTVYYRRSGNTMWLKFALKTLVAAAETNLTFGTLKLSALGVANIASTTWHTFPFCGENGIVLCSLTAAGKLTTVDVVIKGSGTSVAAASTIYGQYTLVLRAEDMIDSFCDKFYWKRTA